MKEEAGKQSARYLQMLDSINREQKSDQDRLDNEGRKKTEIESKLKQKSHMRDESLKRREKLVEHIRTSESSLEDQKKIRSDLQCDVGTSKERIQSLQHELENISEQLGDAKVDKHEVSRTKKKTEIVENFKRLFPGVVNNIVHRLLLLSHSFCYFIHMYVISVRSHVQHVRTYTQKIQCCHHQSPRKIHGGYCCRHRKNCQTVHSIS